MGELVRAGGKRLRPALVLLAANLGRYRFERVAPAAIAVELVHAATLVHDDVIDRSDTRRGRPTVRARQGDEPAIVVGDFYFAKAYREASRTEVPEVVSLLAAAVMRVCHGELQQQRTRHRYRLSVDRYLRRIELKTASLLAASCEVGALLGELDDEGRRALTRYGQRLGMAFQVADDVLDYLGSEEEVGKPVGHDLLEGFATLPLMLALEGAAAPRLRGLLREGQPIGTAEVAEAVSAVREAGAPQRALARAREWAEEATWELAAFSGHPAAAALARLAEYVVSRNL
jgi:heptaprenyl diphosphate synthase